MDLIKLQGRSAGDLRESWVFLAPIDTEFYDGSRMRTITKDDAKSILAEFRKANYFFEQHAPKDGSPYRFPVLLKHTPEEDEEKRYGDILEAKISGDNDSDDRYGIYAKVRWTDETWKDILDGKRKYVSIGIDASYTLEDGSTLGPILTEFSLTPEPRLQSIGSIQDTLDLELSRNINFFNMENKLMEELLDTLKSIVARLEEDLEASEDDKEKDEDVEASEDSDSDTDDVEASEDDEDEDEDSLMDETVEGVKDLAEMVEDMRQSIKASKGLQKDDVKDLVEDVLDQRLKASRSTPLHLSEVGTEDAPPRGKPSFDERKNQLMKSGMSRDEALQSMREEGY